MTNLPFFKFALQISKIASGGRDRWDLLVILSQEVLGLLRQLVLVHSFPLCFMVQLSIA